MGEFEAIGEAVSGGLLARAVEPTAGEAADKGHTHETSCLNCAAPLVGAYCSNCGQKAHVHRSLRAFMGDFIAGIMNFEGKFWRTLPMLAWRPGEMTRRYIAGERARFISPIALYLFTVFAMFAVLNFNGTFTDNGPIGGAGLKRGLTAEIAADQARLDRLGKERAQAASAGEKARLESLDRRIAEQRKDISDAQKVLSGEVFSAEVDEDTPEWIKPFVENAKENPEAVSLKIQDSASKYSWLLIPISVPFLWLLFPFSRRYRMYDHTVFVTYSLSFMMILVIVAGLFVAVGMSGFAALLFFVPPFHMYRQLKGAYQLGRVSALLRTFALVSFSFAAAGMFAAATVAIGAM